MLSNAQIERYSRQIILPQVGGKGQECLLQSRVLVFGNGPLQFETLLYLVAVGIGTIGIIADQPVLFSSLFTSSQEHAIDAMFRHLNPDVAILPYVLDARNQQATTSRTVKEYDLVVAEPTLTLHSICYAEQRPLLCANVSTTEGWIFLDRGFQKDRPCFYCRRFDFSLQNHDSLFAELGAAFLGTMLVTEAVRYLLSLPDTFPSKRLICHFPSLSLSEQRIDKNPACSFCNVQ